MDYIWTTYRLHDRTCDKNRVSPVVDNKSNNLTMKEEDEEEEEGGRGGRRKRRKEEEEDMQKLERDEGCRMEERCKGEQIDR